MGRHGGKNKKSHGDKSSESNLKIAKASENSPKAYEKDTAVFILMSQELKDEGNRLFQKRDYESAMLKYEKAIKLLPRNHIDVSYLRSNMAACYMQLGISEYPRAIHECNLSLEVTPKYSKALLKRARCYEALNRLDLARRDVGTVLKMEPNNLMAIEIAERVEKTIEMQGSRQNEIPVDLVPLPEYLEPPPLPQQKAQKEKSRKKKSKHVEEKKIDSKIEGNHVEEKRTDGKIEGNGVEEKKIDSKIEGSKDKKGRDEEEMKGKTEDKKADVMMRKTEDHQIEERKPVDQVEENIPEDQIEEKIPEDQIEEKKAEDKLVVEERKISNGTDEEHRRTVKLVFGEDIRWAQIPFNCSILKLREIISDRFPSSKAVLVKYRDQEGDLITITTTEELRLAEASAEHSSLKLYIVEVNPDQDPFFQKIREGKAEYKLDKKNVTENGHVEKENGVRESACISDWIVQFAHIFKNNVGFDVDAYLDLHELGMKLYSDALEETVTSEEAQDLFSTAAEKFQEMAALALFNWGNVHMSRARKRIYFTEESSKESLLTQVKSAYDWAQSEYTKAGKRYEEALKIKPNFYEAVLALGQQQFEQAKLSWYYAVGTNVDLESWPSTEVVHLYNKAEENMEKGMQMWEDAEERRLNELSQPKKVETLLQRMKLDNFLKQVSADEAAEQAEIFRSQIKVLWGTMLYERSIMEFKLGLPVWQECLEVAVEKFELAGASPTDIAVMIKNHCSNDTALEGLGFNIDEIVQAWNEMYEAKKWQSGIPSYRLEPLLRRRVSKL
ncbi:Myosin assembly protein/sexual cycle protein [Handroanthus impetiginosus]|uniref:Myosin assembly protein/sexual cycle protein n=1 Tax=Handroanthus impetiginosus TaxID=429701 RepID=A0A2G9HS25_9LAMI|nr:Myosin assembly protein/sexual cycle protein [Handroanthus impetiginosus]